jgi:hypothetical protein
MRSPHVELILLIIRQSAVKGKVMKEAVKEKRRGRSVVMMVGRNVRTFGEQVS